MRYPECGSEKVVKDGKQRGKQTYLCKVCHRRFTPSATKLDRPSHIKQKAIKLYINGMSINAISKVLNIPYMTVWRWVNKAGQRADKRIMRELEKLKRQGKVKSISIERKYRRVNRNEAIHSKLRDKLVSFKRRTKAFFRSFHSLRYALVLFTYHYLSVRLRDLG